MLGRKEKVVNTGKNISPEYLTFECSGGSMRPLLNHKKKVFIDANFQKIVPGDCVCFKIEEAFFIHRAIKITGDIMFLDSDSASTDVHRINKSQIIGKLAAKNILLKGRIGLIFHHISKNAYLISRCFSKRYN